MPAGSSSTSINQDTLEEENKETESDDLLKETIESIPIEDGYGRYMPDVIVPLSIHETFEAFWANDSPFFEPELTKQMGNTITDAGSWATPTEPVISFGQPV